ncbi:MAG: hypothetical protein ABIG63_19385 [Chloroflexota bacterium]
MRYAHKHISIMWTLAAVLYVAAGLLGACSNPVQFQATELPPTQQLAATSTELPPAATPAEPAQDDQTSTPALTIGETLLQARCTVCHSLGRVEQAQKTSAEWERTVARMVGKGAELDENEQVILIEYLAENYGP